METVRLTVGQAIVRFMAQQYVERDGREQRFIAGVWGIFGHGNVAGLGQALEELGDAEEMPYYRPQNEQAQVHIATAFARHRNRLRTYACTSSVGPGALNMVTGAATATVNRIPVLLLPSDYFANRAPDPVLQQVEHPIERDSSANDAFRPVSRFFDRITRPEQLLASLPEAFRVLTDPVETGAVTISLPEDVQAEAFDWPSGSSSVASGGSDGRCPSAADLADAVRLIAAAKAPLIVTGGGTIYSEATDALVGLRDAVRHPRGRDAGGQGRPALGPPDERRDRSVRTAGSPRTGSAHDADLVIGVGHPDGRLRDRVEDDVPEPRRHGSSASTSARWTPTSCARCPSSPTRARRCARSTPQLSAAGYAGTSAPYRERVCRRSSASGTPS